MGYKWCVVPQCKNSSTKTPSKLFISVPRNPNIRKKWMEAAQRKPDDIRTNTNVFMCEDHFDLPNDMEDYMRYRIMGGLKQVRMKKDCVPTKFDCQPKRKVEMSTLVNRVVDADETKVPSTSGIKEDLKVVDVDRTEVASTSSIKEGLKVVGADKTKVATTSGIKDADRTKVASTLAIERNLIKTSAVLIEVPDIEPDQPEYWYPEKSDSTPVTSCNNISNTEPKTLNPQLNPKVNNPKDSFSEEYQRFLKNSVSNPKSKKGKPNIERINEENFIVVTRYFDLKINDAKTQVVDPLIVKQEIEEIIVDDEREDVPSEIQQEEEKSTSKDNIDSVKTEAIEIGEVFFTPTTYEAMGNEEGIKEEIIDNGDETMFNVSSSNTDDAESTETASEAEYDDIEEKYTGIRRKKRRISDVTEDNKPKRVEPNRHNGNKPHKCPNCNFITRNAESLNFHILDVHQKLTTKSFKCKYCNYNTDIEKFLEKHVMRIHSHVKKETTSTEASMKSNLDIKQLKCEQCDFKTHRECTLKDHIKNVHLEKKKHKCEQCDYVSLHRPLLAYHINKNHSNKGRLKCELCNYRTSYKTHLKKHTETAHSDLKKYKCQECDYRGNTEAIIETHRNRAHLKVKKLKCERCTFETFCEDVLDNHNENVHNEFYLNCEFCYFRTQYSEDLKKHVDTMHFKSEGLACCYCDYTTAYKTYLKRHLKTNHPSEDDVVMIEKM